MERNKPKTKFFTPTGRFNNIFWVLILVTGVSTALKGQREFYFADTIYPISMNHTVVPHLDSLETRYELEFRDTLKEPFALLIESYPGSRDQVLSLAIPRKKGGFEIYEVFRNTGHGIATERLDLNGYGKRELLIRYVDGDGRSGWQSGWSDRWKGFAIVDLDQFLMYGPVQHYYSYLYWENDLEMVESDSGRTHYDITGSSMAPPEGSNFEPAFEKGSITFTERDTCNDFDENIVFEIDVPEVVTYELQGGNLIKIKTP